MGQLAEAVADVEVALSLDPSNKEIVLQLKGLRTDLLDTSTAKQLQQQLQQNAVPAAAAPSENSSPQDIFPQLPLDSKIQASEAKPSSSSSSSSSSS